MEPQLLCPYCHSSTDTLSIKSTILMNVFKRRMMCYTCLLIHLKIAMTKNTRLRKIIEEKIPDYPWKTMTESNVPAVIQRLAGTRILKRPSDSTLESENSSKRAKYSETTDNDATTVSEFQAENRGTLIGGGLPRKRVVESQETPKGPETPQVGRRSTAPSSKPAFRDSPSDEEDTEEEEEDNLEPVENSESSISTVPPRQIPRSRPTTQQEPFARTMSG